MNEQIVKENPEKEIGEFYEEKDKSWKKYFWLAVTFTVFFVGSELLDFSESEVVHLSGKQLYQYVGFIVLNIFLIGLTVGSFIENRRFHRRKDEYLMKRNYRKEINEIRREFYDDIEISFKIGKNIVNIEKDQ